MKSRWTEHIDSKMKRNPASNGGILRVLACISHETDQDLF